MDVMLLKLAKKRTQIYARILLICSHWDFTGGSVVKNLPCNVGNTRSIPGLGTKIPFAAEQLCPCSAITKPQGMIPHDSQISHMMQQRPDSFK